MIRLDTTLRTLEAFLNGAATAIEPQCMVSFYDVPGQNKDDYSEYRGATKFTNTNGTTAVTICAAPTTNGTIRNIDHICVYNADNTGAVANVRVNDNGTTYLIKQATLTAGQSLVYERDSGWQVL